DGAGATHVFLCDGYAATAEAMQAASLSDVLDVHSTMSLFSPTFELPVDAEGRLMQLDPSAPDFAERLKTLIGGRDIEAGKVRAYAEAIHEAAVSNMPLGKPVLRADDFLPEKSWSVLACVGYMCEDPYTGSSGITQVGDRTYRVSTLLATRKASSRVTFTLRLMEGFDETRQGWSPSERDDRQGRSCETETLDPGAASGVTRAAAPNTSLRVYRQPNGAAESGAGSRYTSRTRSRRFSTQ